MGSITSMVYVAGMLLAWPSLVHAQYAPKSLNISGALFQPNGLPVTSTSVDFRIEIWDKNATCKLYEETHLAQNLSQTKGGFSLQLGQGSSISNHRDAGNPSNLSWLVFANPGGAATVFAGCGAGVVFAQGDNRLIRVYYNLGGGMTAMTPDVPIESSAYAMVADTLEGKKAAEFIQVRDDVGTDLNQSNVETVFSATNYAKLLQLLNNTFSAGYSFNNQRITNVGAPTAGGDAVNRTWVDGHVGDKAADLTGVGAGTNNGHTLIWDAGNNRWTTGVPSAIDNSKLPLAGGTMSGPITMGGYDLYNTGHITMGNQRMLTLGRYTNAQEGALGLGVADEGRMFYNTEMNAVRVWDGTQYIGFGASGVAGGDLTGSYPNPTIKAAAVTNTKIADDAVQSRNIDQAGIGMNRLVISDGVSGNALRFKTCALNQILRWEATGWQCVDPGSALPNTGIAAGMYGSSTTVPRIGLSATGVVTSATDVAINFPVVSVNGKTGVVVLNGADLGLGTASLEDVGNGANEVPMTDGTGKLDRSVIPTLGIGDITGAITQIVAGSGLTGGGTQGVVTLAVDLAQVDAYKLRGRDLSSVAPADNEVLMWNALTNTWLSRPIPSAPVTTVAGRAGNVVIYADDITSGAGRYLTYAPNGAACSNGETLKWNGSAWLCGTDSDTTYTISGTNGALVSGPATNRTISIDTGVTTGQIVQVAAGNRLPVIDGSNLTQISNLRNVNVSTTTPISNQVLRYNGSAWEPATLVDNAGVTYVEVSSDLTGGPITATGTIGVNTGTGSNQILKLNGSSQIPAVDGSLLTFVNAASIRGVNVSTLNPSSGQVLKFNGSAWEAAADTDSGIVTLVGNNGALVSGPALTKTISIDTGVTTGQIVQVAAGNRLPVIDGSNLTQISNLRGVNVSTTAPTLNQVLKYNGFGWEAATDANSGGTVTLVATGSGMAPGNITATGTISVDVGTGANQIVQLDGSARLPAVNGSLLTNVNAVALQTYAVHTAAPADNQVLTWNATATRWEARAPGAGADDLGSHIAAQNIRLNGFWLSGDGNNEGIFIPAAGNVGVGTNTPNANALLDINGLGTMSALLVPRDTAGNRPTGVPGMIRYNTSTAKMEVYEGTTWADVVQSPDGVGVSYVATTSDLTGGPISATGTLGVNTGTGANQILKLNGSSQIPAVDGSLLTFVNAASIRGVNVSTTSPTSGQVMRYNGSAWEAFTLTDNAGVTLVTAGSGLLGGTVTATGTISVDVGTGANQIVQLDGSSRLPAVDGRNLTQISNLRNVNVATTTPTLNQVLQYNGSAWEAATLADNGIVTLVGNNGALVSGPAAVKTISIDTGVTTGQIVQVAAGNRLPVIDGSNLTQISNLRNVNVSTATPTSNQVLRYNGSAWEAATLVDNAGVTLITAGSGLLGGTVTAAGTISVDVGTGANKIVQLDGSSRLPAVNGSLLTNVNAVKLQTYDVDSAAPADNQVLTWNATTTRWEARSPGAGADNLGSHIAAQNIRLNGFWLSGDGNNEGIFIPAAGNVGVGTNTPNANAILDVNGVSATSAMIVPRDTQANRPTGVNGMIRYNTNTAKMEVFENGGWTDVVQAGDGGITTLTGTNGALVSGTATVKTVSIDTGVTTGQIVQVAAGNRLPVIDGSNLTQISNLRNVNVSTTAPTSNQVLRYNGSAWEAATLVDNAGVTLITAGTGLLGGTITGTGTIRVDVGIGANQIPQLNSSGFLGIGTATVTTGAVADFYGVTNLDSAVVLPRATSANRPAGTNGMIRYNTSLAKFEVYENGGWATLATGSGSSVSALDDLTDAKTAPGTDVIFIGSGAGNSNAAGGINNIGIGSNALFSNSTGDGNVAIGKQASEANTGNDTVAIGTGAGWTNGISGARSNNVFVGSLSGYTVQPGSDNNVALGYGAGSGGLTTAADGNVLIGYQAGDNVTSGARNIVLGFNVDAPSATLNDQVTIGNLIYGTGASGTGTTVSGGRVGIMSNAPQAALDVVGTGASSALIVPRDNTAARAGVGVNGMLRYNTNTSKFEVYANNAWADVATGSGGSSQWNNGASNSINYTAGRVGVGTTTLSAQVHIYDSVTTSAESKALILSANTATLGTNAIGAEISAVTTTSGAATAINVTALSAGATGAVTGIKFGNVSANSAPLSILQVGSVTNGGTSNYVIDAGNIAGAAVATTALAKAGNITANSANAHAVLIGTLSGAQAAGLKMTDLDGTTGGAYGLFVGGTPATTSGGPLELVHADSLSGGSGQTYGMNTGAIGTSGATSAAAAVRATTISGGSDAYAVQVGNLSASNGGAGVVTGGDVSAYNAGYGYYAGNISTSLSSATAAAFRAGTVSSGSAATGLEIGNISSSAFASSSYGIKLGNVSSSGGGTTNVYGLYLGTLTGSNRYAIWSPQTNATSFIGGSLGLGHSAATAGAVLDLNGTGTNYSSMLVPRDTAANRPTGVNGMIRYNTNTSKFEVYANNAWADVATGSGGSSQWTSGTGGDIYYNSGSVGIGVTNPTAAFEIDYGTNTGRGFYAYNSTGATANNPLVQLYTANAAFDQPALDITYNGTMEAVGIYNSGTNAGLYIGQQATATGYGLHVYTNTNSTANSPLAEFNVANAAFDQSAVNIINNGAGNSFVVNDQAGDTTPFVIDAAGEVGIGTNNPNYSLDIQSTGVRIFNPSPSTTYTALYMDNNGQSVIEYRDGTGASKWEAGHGGSSASYRYRIYNASTASESVTILTNGSIGLGNTNPTVALDVNGTGNLSAMLVPRATTAQRPITAANGMIRYNTNISKFDVYQNNGWNQVVVVNPSGNVGIGTDAPGSTLDVNGAIKVGNTAAACNATTDGALKYVGSTLSVCKNGTGWVALFTGTEADPQVGTLTAGKWCTSDGTTIDCTTDAPSVGLTSCRVGVALAQYAKSCGVFSANVWSAYSSGNTAQQISTTIANGETCGVRVAIQCQ